MLKPGIRRRLLLTFTMLTTTSGLLLFLIAGRQLENAEIRSFERDLQTRVLTVAAALSGGEAEAGEEGGRFPTGQELQTLLARLDLQPESQFAMIDASGLVLIRSPENPDHITSLPQDQLRQVFNGQTAQFTRPDHTGVMTVFTAAPLRHENQAVYAAIWLATPLDPVYVQTLVSWMKLAAVVLPVIVLNAAVSLWLGQAIARPILQLRDAALRIADGALHERIKTTSRDETGQLAHAFNTMVESLNQLLTAQRSFVSNAAHELRTPLMSLKLRIEAVLDEDLPADQRQTYLVEAGQEVQRMAELVTSLLTLARLDEGKHRAQSESFDTGAALHDIAYLWRNQAQQAGLTLHDEITDPLPRLTISLADLRIVLDNLLNNAVKYTPAGGKIWLKACNTPPNSQQPQLCITVSDTGEGFAEADQQHLFERFYRAERSRSAQISGHGLGLAIVSALIERSGGTISASSPGIGQGATFTVQFPVDASPEALP